MNIYECNRCKETVRRRMPDDWWKLEDQCLYYRWHFCDPCFKKLLAWIDQVPVEQNLAIVHHHPHISGEPPKPLCGVDPMGTFLSSDDPDDVTCPVCAERESKE